MQKTMFIKPIMLTLMQNMDLNSSHASALMHYAFMNCT